MIEFLVGVALCFIGFMVLVVMFAIGSSKRHAARPIHISNGWSGEWTVVDPFEDRLNRHSNGAAQAREQLDHYRHELCNMYLVDPYDTGPVVDAIVDHVYTGSPRRAAELHATILEMKRSEAREDTRPN